MEEEKEESAFVNFFKQFGLILAIILTFGLVFFIINRKSDSTPKKISKSELANQYGVPVDLLMQWASKFLPEETKKIYVGEKVKTVKVAPFYEYLGKPSERPKKETGEIIISKKDLAEVLFMNPSTLMRKVKKIENPTEAIGMSHLVYKSLKTFPPKHIQMIITYFETQRKSA